jgi:hypothetical protein
VARTDRRGLQLSTDSDLAAERYGRGVDLLLAALPGAEDLFRDAIDADPDFALAYAALARQHAVRARLPEAKACIAAAGDIAARRGDERERSHVQALSAAIHGKSKAALALALDHIRTWPRDVLVFSLPLGAFGLFAFSGMADHNRARVDLCARHASHFDPDDWWFLTYQGWAYAENGDAGRGRPLLERAHELNGNSANTVHALAHAMIEGGAVDDAERLTGTWLPAADRTGAMHGHIAWHAALLALEREDPGRALDLYRDAIQPSVSSGAPINVVSDTASLLWRLQAYGHPVPGDMWETVAAYARGVFPKAGHAFIDIHMALIDAAAGDANKAQARIEAVASLVEAGMLGAGAVVPAVCEGVLAFADRDYGTCVRLLEPVARDVVRIGGSGAQREVVEDTLLVALIRSGAAGKARALLEDRLKRRSMPRDQRWHRALAG